MFGFEVAFQIPYGQLAACKGAEDIFSVFFVFVDDMFSEFFGCIKFDGTNEALPFAFAVTFLEWESHKFLVLWTGRAYLFKYAHWQVFALWH